MSRNTNTLWNRIRTPETKKVCTVNGTQTVRKMRRCFVVLGWALLGMPVLATKPAVVDVVEVDLQFYRGIQGVLGDPIPATNPHYGHAVLDPGLEADWVFNQNTIIPFTFQANSSTGYLAFEISSSHESENPPITVQFPLSLSGQVDPLELHISDLFNGMMVEPFQVYSLRVCLEGQAVPEYQVQAFFNNTQAGWRHSNPAPKVWPPFPFRFYYDDGTLKPPGATVEEKVNPTPPHYFSNHAALGTINGQTAHGAIAHYTYRLHDTNLDPQIFDRRWKLFRVENGSHTPLGTPGIPRGDRYVDLDFVAPADPGNVEVHYRLYCLTYDGRGVAGEPFSINLTGDDLFYLKVGPDPTTQPGICLRVGWQDSFGGVIPALDCDGDRFPEGKIFAMPVGAGIDPMEDYYGLRYAYATGSPGITGVDKHPDPVFSGGLHDPNYWHYKNPQPNQFPMSIQWRVRTRYGLSEYSAGTVVTFEPPIPNPDPFETDLSFDWRDPRPPEIIPGMVVKIEMHLNRDDDHVPYFTLWIFNSSHPERNYHLVIPGQNLTCLPANAGSSGWYSGWRVPDDIGTILHLEADEQAVLRAKVKWIDPANDPLPCESSVPFLFDFDESPTFDEQYPEVFADSARVGGETGEAPSFDQFFFQTDGNPPTVTEVSGSVNVIFIETHGGSLPPTRILWRWRDGTQYWHDGTWTGNPAFSEVDINGTDAFSQRWEWDQATGLIEPAGPHGEPLAGFISLFFGVATSRDVTIETKMIFDQGGESIEVEGPSLPITFNLNQTDVGIEAFILDGGFGEISHLHTTQGQIPDLTFTIDTDSPHVQDVYLALHHEETSLHCGTLSELETNENLFTVTQTTTSNQNLRYILTAGSTSELHNLLNGGTGVFQITVATDPCENGAVPQGIEPKTITVNPGQSFLVRVHYRDHLGSSVLSKAYSPVFTGSETGQDPMVMNLAGTTLHLYPRPTEHHHYDPFGAPIPNVANEDKPRYTDHEYDPTSGFNYMKGRFQLADIAKFNRPDPARDWDWINPHSLNLYQYVRNDPINGWDPNGYRLWGLDQELALKSFIESFKFFTTTARTIGSNHLGGLWRPEANSDGEILGQFVGDVLSFYTGILSVKLGLDGMAGSFVFTVIPEGATSMVGVGGLVVSSALVASGISAASSGPINAGNSLDRLQAFSVGDKQANVFRGRKATGFNWSHILDRHSPKGPIAQRRKRGTIFEGLTDNQIKARVRSAWKHRKKIKIQIDKDGIKSTKYRGTDPKSGQTIEMWLEESPVEGTRIINTAYPVTGGN